MEQHVDTAVAGVTSEGHGDLVAELAAEFHPGLRVDPAQRRVVQPLDRAGDVTVLGQCPRRGEFTGEPPVGHVHQAEPVRAVDRQQVGHLGRVFGVVSPGPLRAGGLFRGHLVGVAVQDDVVAVPGQLGVLPPLFELQVDAGDRGEPGGQPGEVVRVDQQLLLPGDPVLDGASHRHRVRGEVGAVQFHRGVQQRQGAQVAHVAEEDPPAGREQVDGLAEHSFEIGDVREVLDGRVEHDQVEPVRG